LQEELTRTGVELPEFRKLGGMLSDDGGANRGKSEAIFQGSYVNFCFFFSSLMYLFGRLHFVCCFVCAEIARMVQQKDSAGLLAALTSPAARLEGVTASNIRSVFRDNIFLAARKARITIIKKRYLPPKNTKSSKYN
jgi:hypothetical protein